MTEHRNQSKPNLGPRSPISHPVHARIARFEMASFGGVTRTRGGGGDGGEAQEGRQAGRGARRGKWPPLQEKGEERGWIAEVGRSVSYYVRSTS